MRKLFSFLIVLFPFLCQFRFPYEVPFLTEYFSVGELVLIPFIFAYFFTKIPVEGVFHTRLYRFNGYFAFSAAAILMSAVAARYSFSDFFAGKEELLSILYFCFLLYAAKGVFNISFGMHTYAVFASFFSLYLIAQTLVYRFYGRVLPDFLGESWVFGTYTSWFEETGHFSSLFLTADAFALYCLPALAFLLLWNRLGNHASPIFFSMVITSAIVLSHSALGTVLAAGIWLVYLGVHVVYFIVHPVDGAYRFMHQGAARVCIQIALFVGAVMLLTLGVMSNAVTEYAVPMVKELLRDPHLSSGFGFTSVLFTSTGIRLHGCGIGNISAALTAMGGDPSGAGEVLNTFGVSLLSTGIVGFVTLLAVLFGLIATRRGKFGFTVACLLLVLSLFLDIAYTPLFGFLFLIAYSANDAEHPISKYLRLR